MILASTSALVVVNMPPPEPSLAREARTLAARLTTAADEAVVSGTPVGVDFDETGYRFRRRVARDWRPIADDRALAPRAWPRGVEPEVVREGERLALQTKDEDGDLGLDQTTPRPSPPPTLRFDAVGSASEVEIELREGEEAWRVTVSAGGEVSLEELRARR